MKVPNSVKYVNPEVADALRYVSAETARPELRITAAWIEEVSRWYSIMSSSEGSIDSLDPKTNTVHYNKCREELRQFVEDIFMIEVGEDAKWKPWQSAVILSYLKLFQEYDFPEGIYTARFNQKCIESLFSQCRAKQFRPNPVQFRDSLRAVMLANITAEIRNAAYDSDNGTFLPVVFDEFKEKKNLSDASLVVQTYTPVSGDLMSNPQKIFLYHSFSAGGWFSSIHTQIPCRETTPPAP